MSPVHSVMNKSDFTLKIMLLLQLMSYRSFIWATDNEKHMYIV